MRSHIYRPGDHVVPTDLPRPFVCRVVAVHGVGTTDLQVLEVMPLHGPWTPDTHLFRGSDMVRPAALSELWTRTTTDGVAAAEPPARKAKVRRIPASGRRRPVHGPPIDPWKIV